MLTRARLDELFALRAAAKADEQAMEKDFKALHGFHPFDRESVAVAGMGWVADRWWELREGRTGITAYEKADKVMTAKERTALMELAEWDGGYTPDLDLLLCILETRRQLHTH